MYRYLTILITSLCIVACSNISDDVAIEQIPTTYDIVLKGGQVIDPESGLNEIHNIGIIGGKIRAVSAKPLQGSIVVDAENLVVSPGFINIHSHSWTPIGQEFELRDGVTTALDLESGAYPINNFGTFEPIAIAGKSFINFGASVGHAWIRSAILDRENAYAGADEMLSRALISGTAFDMETSAFRQPLSADQLEQLSIHLKRGLDEGGLGIGMLLDYMSEVVDEAEMQVIFDIAADRQAPISVHIRRGIAGDTAGLLEVIRFAKTSGAPVHICHVQASAMNNIREFLRLIREARAEGVQITTESFPYNAGYAPNTAAVFNRNWQKIFAITYEDIQWAVTGERFTKEMWHDYRETRPGGTVIHHYNQEEWTRVATESPDVIVAADGPPIINLKQKVAPFGIGTNSRILGHYVREKDTLSLTDAIAKMTYLPAKVLQAYSPSMANKGRIKVGADADITVFDSSTIIDNATYKDPYQASTGIVHVIVSGQFVIRDSELLEGIFPGQRILR